MKKTPLKYKYENKITVKLWNTF